jgi:serine phosphatase RsbU (regulator of sigma subunit)
VRIEGTDLGRCFAAQQVLALPGPDALVAPVSVRGDRLGVLEVRLPGLAGAGAAGVDAARRLGGLLGQALLATNGTTDVYRTVRRGRPLTLSAEMQWELLPGNSLETGYAGIAGQLEPAYSVVGDAYDWAEDPHGLTAALVDGAGSGVAASSNAAFTMAALRNARREGADLTGMARMADQALHARHGGALFSSAILLRLDAADLNLHVVVAGAGTLLHVGRRGIRVLDLEPDPPLGAEEDYPYRVAARLPLEPGDRVLVVSDGLSDAQVREATFGAGLPTLVHGLRLLGAAEVVRALIRELRTFHSGQPQQDDAVVLCLDAHGRAVSGRAS